MTPIVNLCRNISGAKREWRRVMYEQEKKEKKVTQPHHPPQRVNLIKGPFTALQDPFEEGLRGTINRHIETCPHWGQTSGGRRTLAYNYLNGTVTSPQGSPDTAPATPTPLSTTWALIKRRRVCCALSSRRSLRSSGTSEAAVKGCWNMQGSVTLRKVNQ